MNIDIFSAALIKTYLYAGITLLLAVFVDYLLRSLIRIPKHFDNKRTRTFAAVTRNIITTVVYIFALYIILTLFGVNLTPLLASASVIGIIIGIGAREIIEDFVNGLFLLSLDSISIGDYLQIGTTFIQGDITEGVVEHIGARTLTIRAENGTIHIIPNGQIKKIINFSRHKSNIFIDIPIKTNQDIDKVTKATENALKQLQDDPEYADSLFTGSEVKGIENFKESEIITFRIILTTSPIHRWEIARRYRLLVKKEFEKHKLSFA
ncbi:MAG TPA: mechanosensitive ion channel family protein [Candidatus Sulfotelmatobacter sp.]|jgi:small-conductance mechanosensitive channel|nr:mechanosensitive ion channel family protein [Candidatus Sulfotelmatobacter sp.]